MEKLSEKCMAIARLMRIGIVNDKLFENVITKDEAKELLKNNRLIDIRIKFDDSQYIFDDWRGNVYKDGTYETLLRVYENN